MRCHARPTNRRWTVRRLWDNVNWVSSDPSMAPTILFFSILRTHTTNNSILFYFSTRQTAPWLLPFSSSQFYVHIQLTILFFLLIIYLINRGLWCSVGYCAMWKPDPWYRGSGAIKRFLDCHPISLVGISKYQSPGLINSVKASNHNA